MWTGRTDGERDWLTHAEFEKLRDHANNFSALMASQTSLSTWQVRFDGGEWEEACGRLVSGGFFDVLGVSPAIGRVFTTAEDRDETPEQLDQVLANCAGAFQCDCRGVGADWVVSELRRVA